jgi:hypothetical protein
MGPAASLSTKKKRQNISSELPFRTVPSFKLKPKLVQLVMTLCTIIDWIHAKLQAVHENLTFNTLALSTHVRCTCAEARRSLKVLVC